MKNKVIVKKYKDEKKAHLIAVVNYKDKNNCRKRKFFTTLKEAQSFVDTINFQQEKYGKQARNISEADTQDLILAKRDLAPYDVSISEVVKTFIENTEILKAYKTDIAGAVKHFIKWNNKKAQSITLNKAIDNYLESLKNSGKSNVHIKTIEPRLKRFMEDFKPSCIVAMIEPNNIEEWLENLTVISYVKKKASDETGKKKITKKELSPLSKNNYRTTLSGFFSYCYRKEYIKTNPIDRVQRNTVKLEEPKIYTVQEISSMLYASKELSLERLYIALGAFAGLRVSELLKVTWDKIHFAEKEIILDASITKTNQRRIVEISDNLLEWLKPYISEKLKAGLVFKSKCALRTALEKFRQANNITWIDNGLRHSSASYHLAQSQNANLTAERMGHSVSMLKKHYMGLVRQADAKTYWNIYPKAKTSVIDASNILKESIA